MKKRIYMLTQLLEKNNISLPECARNREGGTNLDDKERVHALVASTSSSPSFIIDSGASRHMVSTRETFSSLDNLKGPKIVLGDDSLTNTMGKGRIDLDHGYFKDVLYVPHFSSTLVLAYQITHIGSPNKFIFPPNEVEITEILNGKFMAKGVVDHNSKVYKFSHFLPFSNPSALLTPSNEERKIWHEGFGHLNYKYISDLSEKDMVIGLPKIKFSKGVCQDCILGKYPEHK